MKFKEGEHIKVWDERERHAIMRLIRDEGWNCKEGKNVIIVCEKRKYDIDNLKFARTLRMARKGKKITREQMAEYVGVTVDSIWNWEIGRVKPREENYTKYCKIVGLNPKGVIESCKIEI
jgi:DNA-binding transcriptional regulator YiaG